MRAATYTRFSSDLQSASSTDAQLRACRSYCDAHNYTIVAEYNDVALSGRSDDRPAFQEMIDAARSHNFDVLVCHKIDRFSRDRYDHSHYKRILQRAGVKLEYVDQRIDDTPEGGLTESLLIGLSEYYSRNLARETMKGLNERAYKAKFNGGIPPLGYNIADGEYVINETEAEAVRFIFQQYAAGDGLAKISQALNDKGFHPKRGGRFGKNSLHDILRNEKYIGIYKFGRVRRTMDGRRNSHKNDDTAIVGTIPAIVEPELFEKIRDKFAENKKRAGAASTPRQYLLSGLLRCRCGHMMVGRWVAARNKSWYVCGQNNRKSGTCNCKMVDTARAEETVIKILQENLLDADRRQKLCDEINHAAAEATESAAGRVTILETELRGVRAKQARFLDAIEEGLITADGKARLRELNAREAAINAELKQILKENKPKMVTPQMVECFVADFAAAVKEKDPDKIRALLPLLAASIDYDGDSIEVKIRVSSFVVPKARRVQR